MRSGKPRRSEITEPLRRRTAPSQGPGGGDNRIRDVRAPMWTDSRTSSGAKTSWGLVLNYLNSYYSIRCNNGRVAYLTEKRHR
jgi:hypothetical protein